MGRLFERRRAEICATRVCEIEPLIGGGVRELPRRKDARQFIGGGESIARVACAGVIGTKASAERRI